MATGNRRSFLRNVGIGSVGVITAGGAINSLAAEGKPTEKKGKELDKKTFGESGAGNADGFKTDWKPVSDRKIRVGIVGFGVCQFGAQFGFQDHPNVTVVAVSDLIPERCAGLAKACRCEKTYPSLEEMVKDDSIEAIFLATDPPHHAEHAILAMKHGKHAATAVPAVWGNDALEQADKLYEAVKTTGKKYAMFETSAFHRNCYAMWKIYEAGGFGKLIYTEGEYIHYSKNWLDGYNNWRAGSPPMWYPTHATAYYVSVSGGHFTNVSCLGTPSILECFVNNKAYDNNKLGTELAMFRTSEGGMAQMLRTHDTPGGAVEDGRVRGQRGSFWGPYYEGDLKNLPDLDRPALPPGVAPGGHGGSHGPLTNDFVEAILLDRPPIVDVVKALNMTVCGFVAHKSALKDGEWMKVPHYG